MSNPLPNPISTVADPTLQSLLAQMQQQLMILINCAQVGEVVSFNPDKQTATVQLKVMRLIPDRTASPVKYVPKVCPLLTDVPVFMNTGGTGRLTFPIQPGDPCLVIFHDRDIDDWFEAGATLPPNSVRTHSLSDGFAFIGVRNLSNLLNNYNTTDAEFAYAGAKLKLNDKVALNAKDATMRTVMQKMIDAMTALNGKTGPSAGTQITAAQTEMDNFLQA